MSFSSVRLDDSIWMLSDWIETDVIKGLTVAQLQDITVLIEQYAAASKPEFNHMIHQEHVRQARSIVDAVVAGDTSAIRAEIMALEAQYPKG